METESSANQPTTAQRHLLRGLPWVFIGTSGYMISLAALTFILPRFLSPLQFGQWQLFQFYILYLGYVTFGYSDGLLLRLAGMQWADLPANEIRSGMRLLALAEVVVFSGLGAVGFVLLPRAEWNWLAVALIATALFILRVTITFVFQATGRAKAVMVSMLTERLVLLAGFSAFCIRPSLGLEFLVASDIFGKLVGLLLSAWLARDVVVFGSDFKSPGRAWTEFVSDCKSGMFVVLSNLSALSLNGVVRLIVAAGLGTIAFGQLSLALQVSTVLLVVVNAVAVAIFPNLRTRPRSDWPGLYARISSLALPAAMGSLLLAVPFARVLEWWSPAYDDAVALLLLSMPVGYFEVKSRGVLAVFMKALRKERTLFAANVVSTVAGAAACLVASFVLHNLPAAALSLVGAIWLRTMVVEHLLRRAMPIGQRSPIASEIACMTSYYLTISVSVWFGALFAVCAVALRYSLTRSTSSGSKRLLAT